MAEERVTARQRAILMAKLLLVSILFALIALPALAARDPNPRRSLKKALLSFVAFNFLYLLAVRYLYARLL